MSGTAGGDDDRWMTAALALAQRGIGTTSDNPSVGCILVKSNRVIGRGRTAAGGRPHAEVIALGDAEQRFGADAARGATAYVTLEPCAHHGKTPPCAEALVSAGVTRVVFPIEDPDPRVSGKGAARLRAAGIAVETGIAAAQARAVLGGYLMRRQAGRPAVTLKLASTMDGRIATASGESQWITGPEARRYVHKVRAESDAILVGVGSALVDDPALTVRLPGLEARKPLRIVADGRLQTPLTGHLAQTAHTHPVLIACREDADPARIKAFSDLGVETVPTPLDPDGALDLNVLMTSLAERRINTVLCEGGGRLAAGLLKATLVDNLLWFNAGLAIGGDGAAAVAPLGIRELDDAERFALREHRRIGNDILSRWVRRD